MLPSLKSASLLSVGKLCDDRKMVIFDKNEVKAINHNAEIEKLVDKQPILIRGKRNRMDNLWHTQMNVPINNSTINTNNVQLPVRHAALYSQQTRSSLSRPNVQRQSATVSKRVSFNNYDCERITMNKLNHTIKEQRKEDVRHKYSMAQVCNNKLNVIIRKDKTKCDLAIFLHKAVGSPVLSTLLKAIDNGHFQSFPGFTSELFKNISR